REFLHADGGAEYPTGGDVETPGPRLGGVTRGRHRGGGRFFPAGGAQHDPLGGAGWHGRGLAPPGQRPVGGPAELPELGDLRSVEHPQGFPRRPAPTTECEPYRDDRRSVTTVLDRLLNAEAELVGGLDRNRVAADEDRAWRAEQHQRAVRDREVI